MFKNERHIVNEWIDHHVSVGFDHIHLLDNGSTDGYEIDEALRPYVTIEHYEGPQAKAYDKCLPMLKATADWVAQIDMDEFLYSKEGTVRAQIASMPDDVSRVEIQMKLYCLSSFYDPTSKIASQTHYVPDSAGHPKCVSRTRGLRSIGIHNSKSASNNHVFFDHASSKLCINHYRFQSAEYLYGIKEQRGGGVTKHKYNSSRPISRSTLCHAKVSPSHIEDTWLKAHSPGVIARCVSRRHPGPATELYPNSSWERGEHKGDSI